MNMKQLLLSCLIFSLLLSSCKQAVKKEKEEVPAQSTTQVGATVPPVSDVIMYEIFVRNFTSEGTFNAILPRLHDLKQLGVNTLWLMPIQPLGVEKKKGTYGSPYSIRNYTELNPDFGTKADFRRLVDSVHALGMYIIIDEVANHTAWDNPWVKEHPEWYTHDSTGKIIPPVADWTDVADLNFDNADLRKEMIRTMEYWIDSFNIDGYRCDAAWGVPDDFWKECIATLRKIRPVIMLAEADEAAMFADGFDIVYGWKMYQNLKAVWKGDSSVASLNRTLKREESKYPADYRALRFSTNHDENSWDNLPQTVFTTVDGSRAAFVFMLSLPGTPLVYNGQEVGYATRINLFEKYVIAWNASPELRKWYEEVLKLYGSSNVLKKGDITMMNAGDDVVAIKRTYEGQELVTLINVRNKAVTATTPGEIISNHYVDVLTGNPVLIGKSIDLRPFDFIIMKKE